jgi:hypothetical protein
MKLKHFNIFIFFAVFFVYVSCDEIIDPDIAKKKVTLYSPADGVTVTSNTVLFKWNEVKGAAKYRLEVVSPTFKNAASAILDTTITTTQFSTTLIKGKYQWTVTAINNTAKAYSDTLSLTVSQSGDLSQYTIANLSPKNAIAKTSITFSWDKIYSAKKYVFVIWNPSWESGTETRDTVSTNYITLSNISEGTYEWGVKALNDSTESEFTHTPLIIDITAPDTPTLIGSTVSNSSVTFQWSRKTDSGSTLSDSLFVATDNTFTNCKIKERFSATSTTQTISSTGTYYWRVRTCDAAGNCSSCSSTLSFTRE